MLSGCWPPWRDLAGGDEIGPSMLARITNRDIRFALYAAQLDEISPKAKPLHGLGGGVIEIAASDESGRYRAVYSVSIGNSIHLVTSRLPDEVQSWNCNAKFRDRACAAASQILA